MDSPTVSYTLRMPADLKRLLEVEAVRRDESLAQVIIGAGWAYLEDGGSSKRPEPEPSAGRTAQKDASHGAGDASAASVTAMGDSQPRPFMNPAMEKFMAREPISSAVVVPEAIILCPKQWPWVDGDNEMYHCALHEGHKGNCTRGAKV